MSVETRPELIDFVLAEFTEPVVGHHPPPGAHFDARLKVALLVERESLEHGDAQCGHAALAGDLLLGALAKPTVRHEQRRGEDVLFVGEVVREDALGTVGLTRDAARVARPARRTVLAPRPR